jgi:PST family polysaccharide transporter
MAVTPLAGILIALAPETVLVFLGPAWTEAVPVFRALAVVAVSLPMNHLGSLILQSAGRADVILRWAPFSMAISLASIFLGMPWGLAGIAFGWALGGLVVRTPLFYLFISRSTHVRFWDMMFPVLDYAVPLTLLIVAGSYLRKVFTFESPVASLAVHGSFLCIGYLVYLFITGKHKILLEMVRQVKRAELS